MNVALYARVSTEEQNTARQIDSMKDYAARNGWTVYKEYIDEGISGTKESRPAFNEMLEDMRQYRFNTIVVTKLDRIGRSLKHILTLFEEFKTKGVNFVATTQNIDTTTSAGKLQLQIIGAFAEFERNIISERTKEGLKGNKRVGKRGKDKKPRQKRGGIRKPLSFINKS